MTAGMGNYSSILKQVTPKNVATLKPGAMRPAQKVQDFSVGKRVYNGNSSAPHSGGGIDLGGYRKRDAIARTTKGLLASRKTLEDWK